MYRMLGVGSALAGALDRLIYKESGSPLGQADAYAPHALIAFGVPLAIASYSAKAGKITAVGMLAANLGFELMERYKALPIANAGFQLEDVVAGTAGGLAAYALSALKSRKETGDTNG